MSSNNQISIYTDGCAKGNPGRGGFGIVVVMPDGKQHEYSAGFKHTTNNRMELLAVIFGLQCASSLVFSGFQDDEEETELHKDDYSVVVYSDSRYVVDAVDKKWLDKWVKTDFAGGKKNKDLWLDYFNNSRKHFSNISFVWVKGHASNQLNNRCDKLANEAANGSSLNEDKGYIEIINS